MSNTIIAPPPAVVASSSTSSPRSPSPSVVSTTGSSSSSSSSSKRMTYKAKLPDDFVPGPYTVICGIRGKQCRECPGNINLKKLVTEHLVVYSKAQGNKADKSKIVSTIMESIKSHTNDGGLFVKQDDSTKEWYEVSDAFSREKIGCVFRDLLHNQYSSSTKAKHERKKALRQKQRQLKKKKQQQQNHQQQQMFFDTTKQTQENNSMTTSFFGKKYNIVDDEETTSSLVNLMMMKGRPKQQLINNKYNYSRPRPQPISSCMLPYQNVTTTISGNVTPLSLVQEACSLLDDTDVIKNRSLDENNLLQIDLLEGLEDFASLFD